MFAPEFGFNLKSKDFHKNIFFRLDEDLDELSSSEEEDSVFDKSDEVHHSSPSTDVYEKQSEERAVSV